MTLIYPACTNEQNKIDNACSSMDRWRGAYILRARVQDETSTVSGTLSLDLTSDDSRTAEVCSGRQRDEKGLMTEEMLPWAIHHG